MKTALIIITVITLTACTPNVYRGMSGFGNAVNSTGAYSQTDRIRQKNHQWKVQHNQQQILDNQRRQNLNTLNRMNVIK